MKNKKSIHLFILLITTVSVLNSCKEHRKPDMNNDGGVRFVLEVSTADIIRSCYVSKNDTLINSAIASTTQIKKTSEAPFAEIFVTELYKKSDPSHIKLSGLKENASSADCLKFILQKTDETMEKLKKILLQRIDKFGIENPTIECISNSGRILIQLPGAKEVARLGILLQASANLQFLETVDNKEIYPMLETANKRLKEILNTDSIASTDITSTTKIIKADSSMTLSAQLALAKPEKTKSLDVLKKENPLFALLSPSIGHDDAGKSILNEGPVVGYVAIADTALINEYFNNPSIKLLFPEGVRFLWSFKPVDKEETTMSLIATRIKSNADDALLSGNTVSQANIVYERKSTYPSISMKMTPNAAFAWRYLTKRNIGKSIAIVSDNKVYSYPTVLGEIAGGISSITGSYTREEADDLVNILNGGTLPVGLTMLQEDVVAPLGK
jgi:SecD/SecF fusion protein